MLNLTDFKISRLRKSKKACSSLTNPPPPIHDGTQQSITAERIMTHIPEPPNRTNRQTLLGAPSHFAATAIYLSNIYPNLQRNTTRAQINEHKPQIRL